MMRTITAPEYRFAVPGRAVSFRSPRAKAYKRSVRQAAKGCLPATPLNQLVELRLDYFHMSERRFDMDNVAKCVLDALNDLAYVDDRLAKIESATAHDLRVRLRLLGGPVDLVKPLRRHDEFLLVRIRLAG